jgi:hypothetical protein
MATQKPHEMKELRVTVFCLSIKQSIRQTYECKTTILTAYHATVAVQNMCVL